MKEFSNYTVLCVLNKDNNNKYIIFIQHYNQYMQLLFSIIYIIIMYSMYMIMYNCCTRDGDE